jgi:hypothetical protein
MIIILGTSPQRAETLDYVDLIEVNLVYDEGKPKPRFEQSIYYRWKQTYILTLPKTDSKPVKKFAWGFEVIDWRQLKNTGYPVKNNHTGNWEQRFWDDRSRCYRKIIAKSFRESHTLYDKEAEYRNLVSINHREFLNKPEER